MESGDDSKRVGRVECVENVDDSERVGRVESVESAEIRKDLKESNLWRVQKFKKS